MSDAPAPATLDLAELVATRLCHDLAGLCGTLQGALELLGDEPDAAAEAASLSLEAAQALSQRLRLIRAAWGRATDPLDAAGLATLATGLPGAPRVALDLAGLARGAVFAPDAARLVLNAILLGAESLAGGGTVRLRGDARAVALTLTGRRACWPERLVERLAAPGVGPGAVLADGPRALQAPLLALFARDSGAAVSLAVVGAAEPAELRIAWPA